MLNNNLLKIINALKDAQSHLDYCGYGDSWERQCAKDSGLIKRIDEAILLIETDEIQSLLNKKNETTHN